MALRSIGKLITAGGAGDASNALLSRLPPTRDKPRSHTSAQQSNNGLRGLSCKTQPPTGRATNFTSDPVQSPPPSEAGQLTPTDVHQRRTHGTLLAQITRCALRTNVERKTSRILKTLFAGVNLIFVVFSRAAVSQSESLNLGKSVSLRAQRCAAKCPRQDAACLIAEGLRMSR